MTDDTIIPPAEQPEPLPVLPTEWPFPKNTLPVNAGEGEI